MLLTLLMGGGTRASGSQVFQGGRAFHHRDYRDCVALSLGLAS